ncbi:hypothetical protein GO009_13675 [Muricauda sp. TY007]|uniref:IPT/TIG domain-containing protein n=1 Tax=Allomuricauda sp. TY007 TaxID=2683200 RepID=UPI0013C280C7|nr:IPT/TIG domain-containing protein [Muricauda sp. TY007]NDV17077.1 hypothetical protein [Muricauda sp. TY007]
MKKILSNAILLLCTFSIIVNCSKDDGPSSKALPSITTFTPKSGTVDTEVTITGKNFSTITSENVVKFGNVTAIVTQASETELKTSVPDGASTSKISVTVNGNATTSTDSFTVSAPINLELNKSSLELHTSDMEQLTVSGAGENQVTWSSDDEEVAIVDESGNVKAVGAGTANITVSVDESQASAEIMVEPSVFVTVNLYKTTDYTASIWKNGSITELTDGSSNAYANSIDIYKGDVFISGSELDKESENYIAKYWKNGEVTNLTDNTTNTSLSSIKVYDDDIYVIGYENNDYIFTAKLWKNGSVEDLSDGINTNHTYDLVVDNQNTYIAGEEFTENKTLAKIWVNGVPTILTDGTNYAQANSIFVSGNDLYVAGSDDNIATLWKNGAPTPLTEEDSPSFAYSVFVDGTDVYVGGSAYNEEGKYIATIWKNGVPTDLTDGTINARVNSVFVYDGDVYAVGYENTIVDNEEINVAKLWVNGSPTILAGTDYSTYAVSVVVK